MSSDPGTSDFKSLASDRWSADGAGSKSEDRAAYLESTFSSPFIQQAAAHALELLRLSLGQKVMEVGCGNGVFLPLLAREVGVAGEVVGVDLSEALVAEATRRIQASEVPGRVVAEVGDVTSLRYADASFDAVHCERVLMHLDDPNRALSEMARIVKPGGRVVATEPDWSGIRIDHPDREGFDRLYPRALSLRQPDMGLTLYRRMGEVGLVDRRFKPVWGAITDFGILKAFGLDLQKGADALVAEGSMTRGQADRLLESIEKSQADGRFFAVFIYHVVSGRVPA